MSIGGPDQNRGPPTQRESSFHDRRRLSSAPSPNLCRWLVPQSFVNVCVAFLPAGRCFISALIVIGVSSTVAHDVVKNAAGCSAGKPTAAINEPVVTKNLVHIESIDVGAAPLVSCDSYVQSVGFRLYHPLFLFPDAGRLTIGDPRSAAPNQCAAKGTAWACSPDLGRPVVLDMAYAPLVRLALCPRHRQAGNGDRLAPPGIPTVLDLEE
jgi:hypothetical protein